MILFPRSIFPSSRYSSKAIINLIPKNGILLNPALQNQPSPTIPLPNTNNLHSPRLSSTRRKLRLGMVLPTTLRTTHRRPRNLVFKSLLQQHHQSLSQRSRHLLKLGLSPTSRSQTHFYDRNRDERIRTPAKSTLNFILRQRSQHHSKPC